MTRSSLWFVGTLAPLAAGAALFFTPAAAQAQNGLSACGNIDVDVEASCKVEVAGGCEAKCEPVNFRASCSARAEVECTGGIDLECNTQCTLDAEASCTANPGSFECEGSCTGSCKADCSGNCEASASGDGAQADCKARCEASCDTRCNVSCSGDAPSVDCKARATASCKGKCEVKSNLRCDVDAQAKCEVDLEGGCKVQCQKPEGALYRDGQYVDTGDNLKSCISALDAFLRSKVDVSASGSADCDNGACEAEGEASASCAASPMGASTGFGSMALLGGGLGLVALIRRRRHA